MFVVEATKTSKWKKTTLELHYRVWSEQPEQERVKSFGAAGGVSVEFFDKIYRTFYLKSVFLSFSLVNYVWSFKLDPSLPQVERSYKLQLLRDTESYNTIYKLSFVWFF